MGLLTYLKKNRIKLLKILITIVVLYFLFGAVFQIYSVLFDDIYVIITLVYMVILILCNFIVEFSPYILNNYLIFIFPFLSHYSGRGAVYIFIGLATISPELSYLLNFGGYGLIIIGALCLYINWLIVKNFKLEYQDFEVMKDNYQDFYDEGQKDSLTFPQFTTNYDSSTRNSLNNNDNEGINNGINDVGGGDNEEQDKNENIENNMLKLKEAYNSEEKTEKNNNIKNVEMKET